MIRSILYADDESYRITGYRRLNPIPNISAERRFLEAAARLFPLGNNLVPLTCLTRGRLAIRLRFRCPSRYTVVKSPFVRDYEVLYNHGEMAARSRLLQ